MVMSVLSALILTVMSVTIPQHAQDALMDSLSTKIHATKPVQKEQKLLTESEFQVCSLMMESVRNVERDVSIVLTTRHVTSVTLIIQFFGSIYASRAVQLKMVSSRPKLLLPLVNLAIVLVPLVMELWIHNV
jgi:hypothetical protein